jgi:hypothetical protein
VGERRAGTDLGGRLVDVGAQGGDDRFEAIGPPRALGGAQRLEQLEAGGEVAQRHPTALEREAEVVGGRGLVGPVHLGAADVAASDRDEALGLEDPDGLPDRRVAHAELLHQLVLGRQPELVGVAARQDALAEVAGDALGDAELRHAGASVRHGDRGYHPYKY